MPLSRKKVNQAKGAASAKAPPCGSLPGMFTDGEKARTVSWERKTGRSHRGEWKPEDTEPYKP